MNAPCSHDSRHTHLGQADQTSWFASPLGLLRIRHDHNTISALDYVMVDQMTSSGAVLPPAWQQALLDYFAGDLDALLQIPIQLKQGTAFQQQVWLALRQIPAGMTYSYRQLAQTLGRPRAVRAVGQALSKNPLSIILPCHRVILQSGGIGGYAGSSDLGQTRKQFLLWHECGFGAQRTPSHPPHERSKHLAKHQSLT